MEKKSPNLSRRGYIETSQATARLHPSSQSPKREQNSSAPHFKKHRHHQPIPLTPPLPQLATNDGVTRGIYYLHAVVEEVVSQVADAGVAVAALDVLGVRAKHNTRGCLDHEQTVATLFSFHVEMETDGGGKKGQCRGRTAVPKEEYIKPMFWERSGEVCQLLVDFLFL